jgi:hypothetical protein
MKLLCCFAKKASYRSGIFVGFLFWIWKFGLSRHAGAALKFYFGDLHGERGSRSLSIAPKGEAPEQLP